MYQTPQYLCVVIARHTCLEAYRDKLFSVVVVLLIALFGFCEFITDIAITESLPIYHASLAASVRLVAVFAMSLFVCASMTREFQQKRVVLTLSQPVSLTVYLLGKLLGFISIAFIVAVLLAIPLLWATDFLHWCYWLLSLICELSIMVAFSLFCQLTLKTMTAAFSAVMMFYMMSRSMHTILLMSQQPIFSHEMVAQQFIAAFIYTLDLLLPDLHQFTQTAWLVYPDGSVGLIGAIFIKTLIYLILIYGAALFDCYRKEF